METGWEEGTLAVALPLAVIHETSIELLEAKESRRSKPAQFHDKTFTRVANNMENYHENWKFSNEQPDKDNCTMKILRKREQIWI